MWVFYPEPSKRVLIAHPDNLESRKMFGLCHRFKVCTSAQYLGGFIGDNKSKRDRQKKFTKTWERKICKIRKTARKCTQESYAVEVQATQ